MSKLLLTAIIASLGYGVVFAVVVFLIWRSPFLKRRTKWIATALAALIAILLIAGTTYLFNKYVLGGDEKRVVSAPKEPRGDMLFAYDVLSSRIEKKNVKVAILVSDHIPRPELEKVIKQAVRDFSSLGAKVDILVLNREASAPDSNQKSFVCRVISPPGSVPRWQWSSNLGLPGERPTL